MVKIFLKNIKLLFILLFLVSCGDFENSDESIHTADSSPVQSQNSDAPQPRQIEGPQAIPILTSFPDFKVYRDNVDENKYYVLSLIYEPILNKNKFLTYGEFTHTAQDDSALFTLELSGVQNERYNALSQFLKMENPNAQISSIEFNVVRTNFWLKKYKNKASINEMAEHLNSFQDLSFNIILLNEAVNDTIDKMRNHKFMFGTMDIKLNLIHENQKIVPVKETIYIVIPKPHDEN